MILKGAPMKKLLAYLLVLSLLIIFVSACGSKNDTPPTSSSSNYRSDLIIRADAGSNAVTLEWQMDSYASTYNIYVGTSLSSLAKVNTTSVSSAPYTVTSLAGGTPLLANGTTYYFSVSGVNSSNVESKLAIPITATPLASPPPAAPENVRANEGDTKVTVTWTPVTANPPVTSYNIYCTWQDGLTAGVGQTINVPGQTSNSKVVNSVYWTAGPGPTDTNPQGTTTALTNGRTYYLFISAVSDNETPLDTSDDLESSASFTVNATPSATPPPFAPVLTTATTGSSSSQQIILTWTAPPHTGTGTLNYTVYYGTAKGVTKSTGTSADVGDAPFGVYIYNLTSDLNYYFVVTATDNNGESTISNEKSAVAY
jgi:hypothetical protein